LHGEADTRKKEKAFFFATKITVWVSVPVCLGLIAWGKPFITRWMGTAYTDAYLPLVFLTIAVFLDVCQNPSVALLNSTFKHRSYAYVNLTEGIINLIASLLLARPLGITGVALGTLIGAFVVRLIMQPWWTCKASGIHFGEYMKFLGGVLLRSGILIGVIIAVTSWGLKPNYQYIATSVLLATALYLAGSFWVVFNPAERKQLLTIVTATAQQWAEPSVACVTD
jgi:O-antigen/teichoic acid export membrane protein